ncbi:MAG TPA: GNAT family N-acetyltransferase [Membranihabitans sp.]|nr:GNAT family N-acetyltransferase [Membranihabitans sp.]
MEFEIKKGKVEDIPGAYSLVEELAVFEKAPDEVVTTPEEYVRLFNEGLFEFYIAESAGEIVGIALYYYTFSTWKGKMLYLEDFVVRQSRRRSGIGKSLFEAVIEEAKKTDCAMMKWQVLDWNESAIRFYDQYDTVYDKGWWNGKLFFR